MPTPDLEKQERLVAAALDLFEERGYEGTTVVAIAERAGLARRTFFRYFADKREVLFTRTLRLEELWVAVAADAPASAAPLDVVDRALRATADLFEPRRVAVTRRQVLLRTHPELQERELMKLARLADVMTEALERRGLSNAPAAAAAGLGVLALRLAFEDWTTRSDDRPLVDVMADVLRQVREVAAAGTLGATA